MTATPRIYSFVENDKANVKNLGGTIVSLLPEVSYHLDSEGIDYSIIEDYYDEKEIRNDEDLYFTEQIKWLMHFDELFKDAIPVCNNYDFALASIHYNRIKYLVDNLVFKIRVLKSFVARETPKQIVVYAAKNKKDGVASIYNFNRRDRYSYGYLLKYLPFGCPVEIVEEIPANPQTQIQHADDNARTRTLRSLLLERMNLKSIVHIMRYKKYKKIFRPRSRFTSSAILFLDAGTKAIDDPIRDFIKNKACVYIKNEHSIRCVSSFYEKEIGKNGVMKADQSPFKDICKIIYGRFIEQDFLNWIKRWTGVDGSEILAPYFKHLIEEISPNVIADTLQWKSFYEKYSISAVIARASAGENYPSALLAAQYLKIPRICFQHGTGPLEMKSWVMDDMGFFDELYTMDGSVQNYFNAQTLDPFPNRCVVKQSSHYLSELRKEALANPKKHDPEKRMRVYYLPSKFFAGIMKMNTYLYSEAWYYRYLKALFKYFESKPDIDFIYKHALNQKWAENTILKQVQKNKFKNITIKTEAFRNCIFDADRIILDFPSTGSYEAAASGLPTLILYRSEIKVWPPTCEIFGPSLQCFDNEKQAIQHIDRFLRAQPEDYQVTLPLDHADGFKTIQLGKLETK